jgi:hypothetical protein
MTPLIYSLQLPVQPQQSCTHFHFVVWVKFKKQGWDLLPVDSQQLHIKDQDAVWGNDTTSTSLTVGEVRAQSQPVAHI